MCVAVALVGACSGGGDDGGDVGGAAGGQVTTTVADDGTTSTTLADVDGLAQGPGFAYSGPSGTGCAPGDSDVLPEGWWAGEIRTVDGVTMDFDLVCFYAGAAAEAAGAEDGVEFTNDYHVRNDNPRTFSVTFPSGDVPATCVGGDVEPFRCTVADVLGLYPGVGGTGTVDGREVIAFPYVWLHIAYGSPDYLYVQFTP